MELQLLYQIGGDCFRLKTVAPRYSYELRHLAQKFGGRLIYVFELTGNEEGRQTKTMNLSLSNFFSDDHEINDVDGDVQRLLLETFDCVVDFCHPVDEVRTVQV